MFALEDQIQRHYKAIAANTLNCYSPFPIAWLKNLASTLLIGTCNDHTAADNAHYKASLVEVVEVRIVDCILRIHVVYQPKLRVYKLRIFIEGPLLVVGTRQTLLELRAALHKAVCLLLAGRFPITRHEKEIGHIAHPSDPGQKSLHI